MHRQPGCWLRSSHTFKECVIAHWSSGIAPKINGAQTAHRSFGIWKSDIRGQKSDTRDEMIASYKDLEVYQESYKLLLEIYNLIKQYPKEETYDMVSQLKRAAMSIPLNIAEGYGKKDSTEDFKRFLKMSKGSVNEVEVLLEISKDIGYISNDEYEKLIQKYQVVGKRISTLIKNWQ